MTERDSPVEAFNMTMEERVKERMKQEGLCTFDAGKKCTHCGDCIRFEEEAAHAHSYLGDEGQR